MLGHGMGNQLVLSSSTLVAVVAHREVTGAEELFSACRRQWLKMGQ